MLVSVPPAWNLTGNAGTNPAADFIGTTDAQPLIIRTNNAEAVRVTAAGQVGVGTTAPDAPAAAVGGTGVGGLSGTATNGTGSLGRSDVGVGVLGISNARGVVGTLGTISCPGSYAVGGCGGSVAEGLFGDSALARRDRHAGRHLVRRDLRGRWLWRRGRGRRRRLKHGR